MNVPDDRRYTEEHEWVKSSEDGSVRIGITDYAQDQLGDIVFVALPEVGDSVEADGVIAEVESTKSVGEVLAPFAGTISAVNQHVSDQPELVNQDPYGDGWLLEMETDADPSALLSSEEYLALIE